MVDIQKEREAFIESVISFSNNVLKERVDEGKLNQARININEMIENEEDEHPIKAGFYFWLKCAESKQVVIDDLKVKLAKYENPDYVLVPKEPTPKMIDATWNFDEKIQDMSHNSRNEFIYNAMIAAAQEQKK